MRLARLLPVLFVVFCVAQPARAETAGQVLAAVGDVLALRAGQIFRLFPGASVESGDQIHTGAGSYLQIRFTDWGIVSLRPRTDFVVDEYVYEARQGGRERAFFSLLNGGVRSLTGLIGHRDRANYRLRTPITTIGIRGTHYSVLMCKQDCRNPDGTLGEDGLYGEVFDGRIAVSPYGGSALEREFSAGERFRLDNEHSIPLQLFSLPPFFPDKLDSQARSSGKPESPIPPVGRILPGGSPAVTDPVQGVTGGLTQALGSIVPAKQTVGRAGSTVTSVSGTLITPLANTVVLPAAGLAGSVVNSALSMPAMGPAFPLLGSAVNSVPAVVAPILPAVGRLLPVTSPIVAPVAPVITPVVNPIVAPVAPVVTPVVNPIVAPVAPVVTPVVNPIVAPVAPVVTPVVNPIVAPVAPVITPVVNPVVAPIAPVIAPLTNTVPLPTAPSLPVTSGLPSLLPKK